MSIVPPPAVGTTRLGLRFADRDVERAFHADYCRQVRPLVRRGILVVVAVFALFAAVDVVWVPDVAVALAPVRVLLFAAFAACYVAAGMARFRLAVDRVSTAFLAVTSGGMVLIFAAVPDAVDFYGVMLAVVVVHACFRLAFVRATLVAGGLTAGYIACCLALSEQPWTAFAYQFVYLLAANGLGMFASYSVEYYVRQNFLSQWLLAREQVRSEELLLNILPDPIARRLKAGAGTIADHFAEVTVVFADLVGFTDLAGRLPVGEVVRLLTRVFNDFDALTGEHGVEKIKTIGDAYMVVAGLPNPVPDHAAAAADFALSVVDAMRRLRGETGVDLRVRVGLHSGPVVAGVIGTKKFLYDLWGDTVNVASRMESHGVVDSVQVSAETRRLLGDRYHFGDPRTLAVKGKGELTTYLLQGRAG